MNSELCNRGEEDVAYIQQIIEAKNKEIAILDYITNRISIFRTIVKIFCNL